MSIMTIPRILSRSRVCTDDDGHHVPKDSAKKHPCSCTTLSPLAAYRPATLLYRSRPVRERTGFRTRRDCFYLLLNMSGVYAQRRGQGQSGIADRDGPPQSALPSSIATDIECA